MHARASALFVPFATATIAFVSPSKSHMANVLLSVLGIIFSLATLIVLYRTREFNHIANERALEIESAVGFNLYSRLKARFKNSSLPSIKITYMLVVGCFLISFTVALGWAICRWGAP